MPKLIKFCNLYSYLEQRDEELLEAIRHRCLGKILSPGLKYKGITFIFPNPELRKKIIEGVYSSNPKEASKIIKSLVIPLPLITGKDFKNEDQIGNLMGATMGVDSVSDVEVQLSGGIVLSKATDFKTDDDVSNIAIWNITSGEMPTSPSETPYTAPKKISTKKTKGSAELVRNAGSVGGVSFGGVSSSDHIRQTIAEKVEQSYLTALQSKSPDVGYYRAVITLLESLSDSTYKKILPMLDKNPIINFYLLVEPYKKSKSDFTLSDTEISGWNYDSNKQELPELRQKHHFLLNGKVERKGGDEPTPTKVKYIATPEEIKLFIEKIQKRHEKLSSGRSSSANEQDLLRIATLSSKNIVDGIQKAYKKTYKSDASKRLWQDEFRFALRQIVRELQATPSSIEQADKFVKEFQHFIKIQMPSNDYESELQYVKEIESVDPSDHFTAQVLFVNSQNFLYQNGITKDSIELK